MQLENFKPYESNTPRRVTSQDKLVLTRDGHERVVTILLTRKNELICRVEGQTVKITIPLENTTWTQEGGFPMIYDGGQLQLWIAVDSPDQTVKPAVVRSKPVDGQTKIALCRDIFYANPTATKEEMIAMFISTAKCTPQGAVTYYITCRKGLAK